MSDSRERTGPAGNENVGTDDRVLRAKYLDWCSARVANRLFKLRPEEIYELSRTLDAGSAAGSESNADFREIVGRLTEELTRELALPDFAQWRELYAVSPRQFDDEMVGFWNEAPE
ncbi:MAG: hypothetical protein ACREKM_03605 [Longimicrobiales bacterium]